MATKKINWKVVLSFAALLALGSPDPAWAVPLDGRLGVGFSPVTLGVEADLSWKDTPFGISSRLGAMGFPNVTAEALTLNANGNWWTTWGHYTHQLTADSSAGLMLGVSQSWFLSGVPIPFRNHYSRPQPFVTLAGVFYQHSWPNVWVRLAPSLTLVTPPRDSYPNIDFWEAAVLGPPIVEFGFKLGSNAELRIRPNLTPIAYTRTF